VYRSRLPKTLAVFIGDEMIKVESGDRCRDCKHWSGRDFKQGYGRCTHQKLEYGGNRKDGWWSIGAFLFYTAKDFGCVHWEINS